MSRQQEILRFIPPGTRGIEIAPWHNPIVPAGGDRQAVALDILDRAALVARSETMPEIAPEMIAAISEVDLLGSACDIVELAAARFGPETPFDFVVSSHNLEHLPDPVRFLRGCEAVLMPGGIVSMAVPDKRACFDFFRPHNNTGDWLQAFHERRERPAYSQAFAQLAYSAALHEGAAVSAAFSINDKPDHIGLTGDVVQAYATWRDWIDRGDDQYHDVHCWTFTPASLELMLTELALLGLLNLDIVEVTAPSGFEFYVHLRKPLADPPDRTGLAERRRLLLHRTADELAYCSSLAWGSRADPEHRANAGDRNHVPGSHPRSLLRRIRRRIRRQFGWNVRG